MILMKYLRLFLALAISLVPSAQAATPRTPAPTPSRGVQASKGTNGTSGAKIPALPPIVPSVIPPVVPTVPGAPAKPAETLAERLAAPQPELSKMPVAAAGEAARRDFEERAFGTWESEGGASVREPQTPSAAPSGLSAAPAATPPPSRRKLMADYVDKRARAARAATGLISTIKTTAVVMVASALGYWWLKGAVLDGQVGVYGTLAVMSVNLVAYSWLTGKAVYNSYKLNREKPRALRALQALMRHDGLRPRTDEDSAKAEEKINASAARFVLARDAAPMLMPMFDVVRAYEKAGSLPVDKRRTERMNYMKTFLRETLDGERDGWSLSTMAGHIAGNSEEALEAFREVLWNDPGVAAAEVLGAEAAVAGVRLRLAAEHSPAYQPWRELKFARERLKEVYASGDARKAALLRDLLGRLAVAEARAGRAAAAGVLADAAVELRAPKPGDLESQLERLAAVEKFLK